MTFYDFVDLSTNLIPLCLFTGLGLSARRFNRLDKTYRLLTCYLLLAFVADILSRVLAYTNNNNLPLVLLFGFFELLFFAVLYFSAWLKKPSYIMRMLVAAGLAYMLWEIFGLRFRETNAFQSYVRPADAFLVVLLSLTFFAEKIRRHEHPEWPLFRLNTAILVYSSASFVFFLPMNFMINQRSDTKMAVWLAYILVTLLFYIFLIREICINGSNRKPS